MTSLPSQTWRMLSHRGEKRALSKVRNTACSATVGFALQPMSRGRRFLRYADSVIALEDFFSCKTDAQLRKTREELRSRFRLGRETPDDLNRGFALVREVAFRQIGERPFPVQVAAGLAMEAGCIAEMATGEGKTLTATMPVVMAGWRGHGCHVVTVNDFLAHRDAAWMQPIYQFCGLTVAFVQQEMQPRERRQAYLADVTYCTNKEVTADFLRDRIVMGPRNDLISTLLKKMSTGVDVTERLVQRGLACALVDEADSVLIDEGVTPLIVSGSAPNADQIEAYEQASHLAAQMRASTDYHIDDRYCDIALTAEGKAKVAKFANHLGAVWTGNRRREELLIQSLHAREFFKPGQQYVIDDGKVVIVDEFTGRLMPDRNWRDGLHQAVEAKEGLRVNSPKETLARISFQRFFRLYPRLAGMTGTAAEVRGELRRVYGLRVAEIPPNRPCIRRQLPDRVFVRAIDKWRAVVAEIHRIRQSGRPVLVGTRSVRDSEHLGGLLRKDGLAHQVLNAVRHADEAQIVAGAGQAGRITVATNMAGRGTDIKLGRGVAARGGLHVIATEHHEASRIDRQLYGRAARQGDPGSVQAFLCLEDELVRRYAPTMAALLRRRYGETSRDISGNFTRALFSSAQRRAEAVARRRRAAVLSTDDWLDEFLGFVASEC